MFKLCLFIVAALVLGPQAVKGQLLGADDVGPTEFPYFAFLRINNNLFCSGALIGPKHILSAGHCVNNVKQLSYTALTALLGTNNDTSGGTVYPIVSAEYHPNFVRENQIDLKYDIGIFTLGSSAIIPNLVDIVRLPIDPNDDIETGSSAVVLGAGYVKDGGPRRPVFQKLSVTIMELSECVSELPWDYFITENHLCSDGIKGKGVCDGDSGGPLVQNGFIIAVVSGFVRPCGAGFPNIYISVYPYLSWINEIRGQ